MSRKTSETQDADDLRDRVRSIMDEQRDLFEALE